MSFALFGQAVLLGAEPGENPDYKAEFLQLCDEQAKVVERQTRDHKEGRQFYKDSYAEKVHPGGIYRSGNKPKSEP